MTYRDDLQAARMRRAALSRELRQVRSRKDEYQELARQEQALEQELAQCAQDLDRARARVELPLLQQVRVASPCKERWDDMTGDERVRFCGRCEKNVYDLSALTASQAEELLRERGESMCVRFFRRSDGTILTSDCPVGGRRKRFWRRVTTAAVASGLAAAGMIMAAPTPCEMQGNMAAPRDWREHQAGARLRQGEPLPFDPRHEEVKKLDRRMANTQARLAAITAERAALERELERIEAEARELRRSKPRGRPIEISEACRQNPLDC